MYNVMQILNADNWCALAVAICYRRYLTPENAFSMYDTGSVSNSKGIAGNGIENYRAIVYMKKHGMGWREIGETLGLRSPQSYFCKLKNKYGGGMNEKEMRDLQMVRG